MVCLSHFREAAAKSLTLEMKLSPPFFTISTWTESVFLHTHTQTRTQLQEEKKSKQLLNPQICYQRGRTGERLGRTPSA